MPKFIVLDTEDRWDSSNEDEILWWPRVLWIDPGVVSGVAVLWFDPHAVFQDDVPIARQILAYSEMFLSGPENGPNGQVNRYLRLHKTLSQEPGLATGCESFVIRKFEQSWEFLAPVRIRAGLEARLSLMPDPPGQLAAEGGGVPLYVQTPSDALTVFTNDRLKTLQMYTPGPDHVNDAKRHVLLWLRKIKAAGFDKFVEIHGEEPGWWE